MIVKSMKNHTLGIICLDSKFPKPVGHVRRPSTFAMPTMTHIVADINVDRLLNFPEPEFSSRFEHAACHLADAGATLIAGSCGFLARYQRELAKRVQVPVVSSSLLALGLLRAMLGVGPAIGVITANSARLGRAELDGVGVTDNNLVIAGMENYESFRTAILEDQPDSYREDAIRDEILAAVRILEGNTPGLGAVVLECTDLSPFFPEIEASINIPVFDLVSLIGLMTGVRPVRG